MLRSDLINRIIEGNGLTNPQYLEIGVHHGVTFSQINSSNKDGVDPGQYCDCPLVNYKMTSDEFFTPFLISNAHFETRFINNSS